MKTHLVRNDSVRAPSALGSTGVPPVRLGVPPSRLRGASHSPNGEDLRHVDRRAGRPPEQAGRLCYPTLPSAAAHSFRLVSVLLVLAALSVPSPHARAQGKKRPPAKGAAVAVATPPPVPETGFALFHMVRQKNIFDPDRRPMPKEGGAKPPPGPSAAGPRVSYLVLTGTMVTEGKRLAFFSGSQSDFNRVVSAHDKVADCEVEAISTSHVDLKRGEQSIVLPVGKQLTLGEKPAVSAAPPGQGSFEAPAPASSPISPTAPGSVPSAAPTFEVGAPIDVAATMRRMMERRQKETK